MALRVCLAALARLSVTRVPLAGLAQQHVRDLISAFQDGPVDDELGQIVAERTDGNPFFVIELVRFLAAGGQLHAAGARAVEVPRGVQDVLQLRLAGLPNDVIAGLISLASVRLG